MMILKLTSSMSRLSVQGFLSKITQKFYNKQSISEHGCSIAGEKNIDEVEVVIMHLFDLLPQDASSFVEKHLYLAQEGTTFVQIHYLLQRVRAVTIIGGKKLGLIQLAIPKVFIEDVHCEVLGDVWLALPVEVVEHCLDESLSTQLQTHAHLVLKVDLHIVTQIAAQMYFHLQWSVDTRQYLGSADIEMAQFGTHLTAVRAIVDMLALIAELEEWVVLAAIYALGQHQRPILIYVDLAPLQQVRGILAVMVQHDLQIAVVCLIPAIKSQLVPSQAPRHHRCSLELWVLVRYSVEQ